MCVPRQRTANQLLAKTQSRVAAHANEFKFTARGSTLTFPAANFAHCMTTRVERRAVPSMKMSLGRNKLK
jgi:hypothetical protein